MTFLENDGVALLFGGAGPSVVNVGFSDTWTYNGTWTQLNPPDSPTARWGFPLVYDASRGEAVLFGGYSASGGGYLGDTWVWVGGGWVQYHGIGPAARNYAAMAYDAARRQIVLFGGNGESLHGDTWLWNGLQGGWTLPPEPPNPDLRPRTYATMAFDAGHNEVVLFGGGNSGGTEHYNDTWVWDGSSWDRRATTGPESRDFATMVYDPARDKIVLHGGSVYPTPSSFDDTWLWNGSSWTQLDTQNTPSSRGAASACYDTLRRRSVRFGGSTANNYFDETWELPSPDPHSMDWSVLESSASLPPPRVAPTMVWDSSRGVGVLVGGLGQQSRLNDTWEWRHGGWIQRTFEEAELPSPRYNHAMSFDASRGVTVLFGGDIGYGVADNQTWEYNGTRWVQIPPPPGAWPRARWSAAMAYDSRRHVTVLFGGTSWDHSDVAGETWEWNGVSWTQGPPGPPARRYHAMAFDSNRGVMVLFGGAPAQDPTEPTYIDTWEYDGTWRRAHIGSSAGPRARAGHSMVFDEHRGVVVMVGGRTTDQNTTNEVWEWDGFGWMRCAGDEAPAFDNGAAAYDLMSSRVLVYRGQLPNGELRSDLFAGNIPCVGDFNSDGGIDGTDVESFFTDWELGHCKADVNTDGGVDGSDVSTFFLAWEGGC